MQMYYSGVHSILIGNPKNTEYNPEDYLDSWKDWHLVPKNIPIVNPPEVQKNLIQVPGMNGAIDLTDSLLGYPLYNMRSGSFEFYVDTSDEGWDWDTAYDTILNELHGFTKRVILTDSPSYFYEGRLSVNQFQSEKSLCSITIDYEFEPFKRMLFTSGEDWLWNPFDFVNGYIVDREQVYEKIVPSGTVGKLCFDKITAGLMPVVPDIILVATGDISTDVTEKKISVKTYTSLISETDAMTNVDNIPDGDSSYVVASEQIAVDKCIKHDPSISIGAPVERWTAIELVNNSSQEIKMIINFRQGRL